MSNLLESSGFWGVVGAIAGAIVGLFAGEGVRIIREYSEIKKLKKVIKEELKSIKSQIPTKLDILEKSKIAFSKKEFLPLSSIKTIDIGYRNNISRIYNSLKLIERNCLHAIYERLRICDEFMDNLESNFKRDIKDYKDREILIFESYTKQVSDIYDSYVGTLELIDSYLDDNPLDPFKFYKRN